MLSILRLRNFRCFESLELDFGATNLLMGENGSGKTSIFALLDAIREVVIEGRECEVVLPLATLPRWLSASKKKALQNFELEIESEWGALTYSLVLDQNSESATTRIETESLSQEGRPLFHFHLGEVHLYRDNHAKDSSFQSDPCRSAMRNVVSSTQSRRKIAWFKEYLRNLHCIQMDAFRMSARSEKETSLPGRDLANFASWYRRALVADASAGAAFLAAIKKVIGGLNSLNLRELGQGVMLLEAEFCRSPEERKKQKARDSKTYRLDFSELSDGQRAIIGLYALIHFLLRENATLCIDEPDNFVSLQEIQPWLDAMTDLADANDSQVILASHHPEIINYLAPDHGIVLERRDSEPATVRKFRFDPESSLPPSELVARGW